jgi:peptide/nickel transport system substrate-binding protein
MRQLRVVLALLLSFALVAAACGNDSDDGAGQDDAASSTADPDDGAGQDDAASSTADPDDGAGQDDAASSTADPDDGGGTFVAAFRANCAEPGTFHTTCGRRLDETVNQNLAMLRWTLDGVEPQLATSWEYNDDSTSVTFVLRPGVAWHDGEPFTADDVVFSYNRYADPAVASTYASKLAVVEGYDAFQEGSADSLAGVKAIDDLTVRIDFASPAPLWVDLQQISLSILPEHLLGDVAPEELNGHSFWTDNRVGTGPFMWDDFRPGESITVVANPDFYGGPPALDSIVYAIFEDTTAMLNALEAGEIDMVKYEGGGIPLSEIERFQAVDELTVIPMDGGLPTFIAFNHDNPRFQDVRVRQAVLYAIDREAIVDTLMFGAPEVANTMFPAKWAHSPNLEDYSYNPERARKLLEDAGWDSSHTVDFAYYYGDDVYADVVVAFQQYLADVGFKIRPDLNDGPTLFAKRDDGVFEMGLFGNGQGLDPSTGSIITACEGGFFTLGYCNERVDQLMSEGLAFADQADRAPIYQEISEILNQELNKAWLWYDTRLMAFANRIPALVEHFQQQPRLVFDVPIYNEVETWTVQD